MSSIAWNWNFSFLFWFATATEERNLGAIGVFRYHKEALHAKNENFWFEKWFFFIFYIAFYHFMTKTCFHWEFGQWQALKEDIFFAFKIPKLRTLQFQMFWVEICANSKKRSRIQGMWWRLGWTRAFNRAFDNTNKYRTFSAFSSDFDRWRRVRTGTSHQVPAFNGFSMAN